jgi:hypothetical protein
MGLVTRLSPSPPRIGVVNWGKDRKLLRGRPDLTTAVGKLEGALRYSRQSGGGFQEALEPPP